MHRTLVAVWLLAGCRFGFDRVSASSDGGEPGDAHGDAAASDDAVDLPGVSCTAGTPVTIAAAANAQLGPSLVWNGTGYGASWYDRRSGTYQFYFARLDAAGAMLGGETAITSGAGHSWFPALAWSGAEYGLTWGTEAASNDIYFRVISSTGVPQSSNTLVGGGNGEAWWSAITFTGAGFFLAWADDTVDNYEIIIGGRDETAGEVFAAKPATATALKSWAPAVVRIGTEIAVAQTENDATLWLHRFAPDTGATIDAELASTGAGMGRPSLAWTGTELGLAFADDRSGISLIYFRRLAADGTPLAPEVTLTSRPSSNPVLTWIGDGYGLVWIEEIAVGMRQLYVAALTPDGALRSLPLAHAPTVPGWPAAAWSGTSLGIAYVSPTPAEDLHFVSVTCP